MKKLTPAQVDETLYLVEKELLELRARPGGSPERLPTLQAIRRKLLHNLDYIKVAHDLKRAKRRKENVIDGHCTEVENR